MDYTTFFEQLQAALASVKTGWAGVIDVETPGGEWWHVVTVADLPAPVCEPGQWKGGADIVIRVTTDEAWVSIAGAPSGVSAVVASGLVATDADSDGAAYTWELWGRCLDVRLDYAVANLGEVRGEVYAAVEELRGMLAVEAVAMEETVSLSPAAEIRVTVGACGSCGTADVKLAEIAGAALCGNCLTLALQAVA